MNEMSKTGSLGGLRKTWGSKISDGDRVRFRLWAPGLDTVRLRLSGHDLPMQRSSGGWFELATAEARAGTEYSFVLPDGRAVADPASQGQAGGVHGPSVVIDPAYDWVNGDWKGRPWEEAVICEIHIGTFTPKGTFKAAAEKLKHLAEIGVTAIEVMPVAQFSGKRGWGYDGVLHYAPHSVYGSPDDFRAFIDAAHGHGIMVLLDVVYNHFGPEGNYLRTYAPQFFRADQTTPWGAAINFGEEAVRRYFVENALYWIGDFRLDGLRLDAVEQIYDTSEKHILVELADEVREAFSGRQVHLVVEDQRNLVDLLARGETGEVKTYTAEWNDDFHHVAHIIATGETVGHYQPFADELWKKTRLAFQHGFVYPDRTNPPRLPTGERHYLPPVAFINFLQNHDQIGNRAFGERLISLAHRDMTETMAAILLLSPQIPFLFMGEEYGETQPFYFFCDYTGALGKIVRRGRIAEAEGFGGLRDGKSVADLPDPNALSTFKASRLQWQRAESEEGRRWRDYIGELLAARRDHIVPLLKKPGRMKSEALFSVDGVLAIDWLFGGSKLELRGNLTEQPLAVAPFQGAVIFARSGSDAQPGGGKLAAHSVVFALSPMLAKR